MNRPTITRDELHRAADRSIAYADDRLEAGDVLEPLTDEERAYLEDVARTATLVTRWWTERLPDGERCGCLVGTAFMLDDPDMVLSVALITVGGRFAYELDDLIGKGAPGTGLSGDVIEVTG